MIRFSIKIWQDYSDVKATLGNGGKKCGQSGGQTHNFVRINLITNYTACSVQENNLMDLQGANRLI